MTVFYILLGLCSFLCLYRIFAGPTPADRIIAVDIWGLIIVSICAIMALDMDLPFLMDITITFALLSFLGSLALAKFLEGRSLDD